MAATVAYFENGKLKSELGITIGSDGSLVLAGDLTVSGTTTTVSSTEVLINDNLLVLNNGPEGAGYDAGVFIQRHETDITGDTALTSGTAQAGGATSVTLAGTANANNDYYNNYYIKITGGTGSGEIQQITDYNGTTKVATTGAWGTQPDDTSAYSIFNRPFVGWVYIEANDEFVFGASAADPGGAAATMVDLLDLHLGGMTLDDDLSVAGTANITGISTLASASTIGNLTLADGSITDSSGAISFGDENLSTTGTLGAGVATLASSSTVGNLTLADGSITDSSGAISFGDENLSTTGTLGAGVATLASSSTVGNLTLADGSITDSSGAISFGNENLSTTGTLASGALTVTGAMSCTTTADVGGALTVGAANDMVVDAGSITSVSGAISFGNENLTTTGTLGAGVATLASSSTVGNLTLADGSITDSSGAISFGNENLTSTGTADFGATTLDSLDNSSGGITNAGAISGATTLAASGQVDFAANVDASLGLDIDADNQSLTIGASADLSVLHNGTNTIATSATGNFILDNTAVTGFTYMDLGTDTALTGWGVRNNTGTVQFAVNAGGVVSGAAFIDDDAFLMPAATTVASSQSIKAYVDAQVSGGDLDFTVAGGAGQAISLDSETLTFTDGAGIAMTGLLNDITIGVDGLLEDLDTLGPNLADSEFLVGTGAGALAWESGATVRTSLGLVIGTNVQAQGDVLDDLNTLGAAAANGEFLVATGAGAFAYESGDTARVSLGVGTSDSPSFTGLTVSGTEGVNLGATGAASAAVMVKFTCPNPHAAISVGDALYLDAAGKVNLADASADSTGRFCGFAMDASNANAEDDIRVAVSGKVTGVTSGLTVGDEVYLNTTAGGLSSTAPSTAGQVVLPIGWAVATSTVVIQPAQRIILS